MSDNDIAARVKKIVVDHLGIEEEKVTENASFIDDLGADSPRYGRARDGLRGGVWLRNTR